MPLGQTDHTAFTGKQHTAGQSHAASVVSMLAHAYDAGPTFGQRCRISLLLTRLHKSRSSRSELEFDLSNFV